MLNEFVSNKNNKKNKKRVGRGIGSGSVKTCGRENLFVANCALLMRIFLLF